MQVLVNLLGVDTTLNDILKPEFFANFKVEKIKSK